MRSILIDTDTASDDAVALIMALRSAEVRVEAITVVAGNVAVAQGAQNALFTAELCGSEVPVFIGADKPLTRELRVADWFHGCDGLGNHGFHPQRRSPERGHAVDAMIRIIRATPGIELVTLGPLTNLALALQCDPRIAENLSRCVVMGGAPCCEGNVTPAAEYNIWVDPEAARRVFLSKLPIEMVGWQLCRGPAVINVSDIEFIRSLGTPQADFALDCNSTAMQSLERQTGELGISLPDPVAMGILLDESLSPYSTRHLLAVETESELTRGMTVVDRLNVASDTRNQDVWRPALENNNPVKICWTLNVAHWKNLLFSSLR